MAQTEQLHSNFIFPKWKWIRWITTRHGPSVRKKNDSSAEKLHANGIATSLTVVVSLINSILFSGILGGTLVCPETSSVIRNRYGLVKTVVICTCSFQMQRDSTGDSRLGFRSFCHQRYRFIQTIVESVNGFQAQSFITRIVWIGFYLKRKIRPILVIFLINWKSCVSMSFLALLFYVLCAIQRTIRRKRRRWRKRRIEREEKDALKFINSKAAKR